MRKILLLCGIAISVLALSSTQKASTATIFGTWVSYDDETGKAKSHIKIYKAKNGKAYGKVVKLLNKPQDTKCKKCSGANKDKPVVGMLIMKGLKQDGNEWEDGTIMDPEKGKTYTCKIWLDPKNSNKLYVRGYLGIFYRTQEWKRL